MASKEPAATFWLENQTKHRSKFTSKTNGKFDLAPHGYVGSVVEVERKIAFDPYVKRAMSRGMIFQHPDANSAITRMDELVIPEDRDDHDDQITKYLDDDAAETLSTRYRKEGLPTQAAPMDGGKTSEQIWRGDTPSQHEQHRTHLSPPPGPNRTKAAQTNADGDVYLDKPIMDVSKVLVDEPVKQGEWATEYAPEK